MRIRTFSSLVNKELKTLALRDTAVVVDGQNYFYHSYEDSGLTPAFGCESDRYADYLREHLSMYQKANVTCYFLFKGGHKNIEKRLQANKDTTTPTTKFMWEIYKEVLTEMGFKYVVCEYESKRETVALAQILNCPIISYDIEFCFSGLQYIPYNILKFDQRKNAINCGYFSLDDFLQRYQLSKEKLAVFIVLTDERIFPEDFFNKLFNHIRAPPGYFRRNLHIMRWLSQCSRQQSIHTIFQFISIDDHKIFEDEEKKARQLIGRREEGGLGTASLLRREAAAAARRDPRWFTKGVAAGHVAIEYINLYHTKHFFGSAEAVTNNDSMILCADIVKYAHDLFTNFNNQAFTYVYYDNSGLKTKTMETYSIRKPKYEAAECVFENGWDELPGGLFEHFLSESLRGVELRPLRRVPADARLLAAALVYFSRKSRAPAAAAAAAAAAVLLSYVMLNVVLPKADKNNPPKFPYASKPILDSSTDMNDVSDADCNDAKAIMAEYLTATEIDVDNIDWDVYHPLAAFQQCLSQLNKLNTLCGGPYAPTVFHRTYNGTLVYKLARAARDAGDTTRFLDRLLSSAPTVYALVNRLIKAYNEMVY